jgi:hypothetical protein
MDKISLNFIMKFCLGQYISNEEYIARFWNKLHHVRSNKIIDIRYAPSNIVTVLSFRKTDNDNI